MADTRPPYSPLDERVVAIVRPLIVALQPQVAAAFAAIAALDGNPSERENDALSAVSAIAAFVAKQLIAQLIQRKRVEPDIATDLALRDITLRVRAEVALIFASAGNA